MIPNVGDEVIVDKRSKITRFNTTVAARPITQRVAKVYTDGRVRTSSGDVWSVKRVDEMWVTVQ